MTRRVTLALVAGGLYTVLFVLLTGVLAPPASASTRLLLGHLLLIVPALAAVLASAAAARGSLGTERAFWSLLAAAAAGRAMSELAFLLQATAFPDQPGLFGLAHAGQYTFHVFVAVAIFVCPHRPLGAGRLRAAILEWTMAAVAGYFLLFYFVATRLGEAAYPWFWIFTLQQFVPAAGFAVLALTVADPPFATVYRILAGGFGAAAVAGILPNWRYAAGRYEPFSAANVDVVLTLGALAAAPGRRGARRESPHEAADGRWRRW
jgi:hypothetical protein